MAIINLRVRWLYYLSLNVLILWYNFLQLVEPEMEQSCNAKAHQVFCMLPGSVGPGVSNTEHSSSTPQTNDTETGYSGTKSGY